jgi:adenosylhomocysteine nucleosidase
VSSIAVIAGMRAEAALLPAGLAFVCTGGRSEQAYQEAKRLLAEGAAGLASFGIAGGIDPVLESGALVIATNVVTGDGLIASDERWRLRLAAALPDAMAGVVAGTTVPVAFPVEKAALFRSWHALSVDLESGGVARACAEVGKPFVVLRAVADPARRIIPRSALAGLTERGRMNPLAVARGLTKRPSDLRGLMQLGLETRRALRALSGATRRLGPTLGFEPGVAVGDD